MRQGGRGGGQQVQGCRVALVIGGIDGQNRARNAV